MAEEKRFSVVQLSALEWPELLKLPSSRFRLFVAADTRFLNIGMVSQFASAALSRGMVYFCAWGNDCERFHDIVDDVIVEDEVGERRFVGQTASDTVMTTWHKGDTLEEALDFFATLAIPSNGFVANSDYWVVVCVGSQDWASIATRVLRSARFSSN